MKDEDWRYLRASRRASKVPEQLDAAAIERLADVLAPTAKVTASLCRDAA